MRLDELRKLVEAVGGTRDVREFWKVQPVLEQMGYDVAGFYQELEMTSRYVDSHRDVSCERNRMNLHSHDFYEVLYCRSNSGIQYLIGTERYRLQRGDIVFVPPGIGHRPILETELAEPYDREIIWMSREFVNSLTPLFADGAPEWDKTRSLLRTAGTPWEKLADYFHTGVREAERRAFGWQAALCGNTIKLLVLMERALRDSGSVTLFAEQPELLDEVVHYIETNLSEKISLADAAKHFWVSESAITQTFRQKMNVSFHKFLTQRRLIAAKSMILEGISMEEVSLRVGFADYSVFYRAFKQEYGISPRQYRKMNVTNSQIK